MSESLPPVQTQTLDFIISQALVDRFAALTGDFNALHTQKAFGRRSNFRENIIHGMFPVAFIAIARFSITGQEGRRAVLKKISARFLKPAFAGDHLELVVTRVAGEADSEQAEYEYHIKNNVSNACLATGFFTLGYNTSCPEHLQTQIQQDTPAPGAMLVMPLTESDKPFENIQKGDHAQFFFKIQKGHARALFDILLSALTSQTKPTFSDWMVENEPTNFLATCLVSTLIGMCIPGKHATFTAFQGEWESSIVWDTVYKFRGDVRFVSSSTRSIVQRISVHEEYEGAATYLSGKATANVNKPLIKMPSMDMLKETALDLGLKDKVVLVTGSSRGLGETTAKLFALHGAKVVVNYFRGEADALRVVDEITAHGTEAIALQADISDREQVEALFAAITNRFGTLHVLVNNAVSNFTATDFMDLTWDDIQKDIDIVVQGAFHCCQAAIPLMIDNKGGKIINLSTVATEVPPPLHTKYVVAKSALVGLTRSLAIEFASRQIQVNLVVPSIVETDLTRGVPGMFFEKMKNDTPMQRNATQIDVAKAVVALASSLTSFTTGQKIMVTGGNAPFL